MLAFEKIIVHFSEDIFVPVSLKVFTNLKVQVGDEVKKVTGIRSIGTLKLVQEFLKEIGSQERIWNRNRTSSLHCSQWLP